MLFLFSGAANRKEYYFGTQLWFFTFFSPPPAVPKIYWADGNNINLDSPNRSIDLDVCCCCQGFILHHIRLIVPSVARPSVVWGRMFIGFDSIYWNGLLWNHCASIIIFVHYRIYDMDQDADFKSNTETSFVQCCYPRFSASFVIPWQCFFCLFRIEIKGSPKWMTLPGLRIRMLSKFPLPQTYL